MKIIKVECYAGYRPDERPLRFQLGDRIFQIESIQDQWYSPAARYFRVNADDGNLYILKHNEHDGVWELHGFRAGTLQSQKDDRSQP